MDTEIGMALFAVGLTGAVAALGFLFHSHILRLIGTSLFIVALFLLVITVLAKLWEKTRKQ